MTLLAINCVLVSESDIRQMADCWPCSGLPRYGYCVSFLYESNGLCDISWYSDEGIDVEQPLGIDEGCLLALSQDAQTFLNA